MTSANTGAMLYQLRYEATHWEGGQFIEFISPVRSDIMSLPMCGFIALLVDRHTGIHGGHGFESG